MKRLFEEKLNAWKDSSPRKPLIIRGARQVGKTYTIIEFGKKAFSSLVVIDFEKSKTAHAIFEKDLDSSKVVQELELFSGKKIIPGQTLLFFDEIQACERALMMLRYFFEEMPKLHVIAAGSLLEFAMSSTSFPVGRVTFDWMRPMTFREFLLANEKEMLIDNLPSIFDTKPVSNIAHQLLMDELRRYMIVGGMPESVKKFIDTNSLADVKKVHEDILLSYFESLVKYNRNANTDSLEHLMKSIPSKVGQQIKYTHLDPDRRIEVTKVSLNILEKALLINLIYSTDISGLPFGANSSSKVFKALLLDIGLLQHVCGINPLETLNASDITSVYKGALAEQFVGQELLASGGSENSKIYYWNRMKKGSTAEVDFVISRKGKIYPIEVKSGAAGKMRSMHQLLSEYPEIEQGFLLSSNIYEKQTGEYTSSPQTFEKLVFKPLYSGFE